MYAGYCRDNRHIAHDEHLNTNQVGECLGGGGLSRWGWPDKFKVGGVG